MVPSHMIPASPVVRPPARHSTFLSLSIPRFYDTAPYIHPFGVAHIDIHPFKGRTSTPCGSRIAGAASNTRPSWHNCPMAQFFPAGCPAQRAVRFLGGYAVASVGPPGPVLTPTACEKQGTRSSQTPTYGQSTTLPEVPSAPPGGGGVAEHFQKGLL
jgi:hypothetical protein